MATSVNYTGIRADAQGFTSDPRAAIYREGVLSVFQDREHPRYLGRELLRIITRPLVGPGIAPARRSRFRSGSARTTCRFFVVTRRAPMCPAMRIPLKTRPGVVVAPIEPGARSRSAWPWVLGPPRKWWRLTTPAKPLPFDVPTTSTRSPGVNALTSIFSPTAGSPSG